MSFNAAGISVGCFCCALAECGGRRYISDEPDGAGEDDGAPMGKLRPEQVAHCRLLTIC